MIELHSLPGDCEPEPEPVTGSALGGMLVVVGMLVVGAVGELVGELLGPLLGALLDVELGALVGALLGA